MGTDSRSSQRYEERRTLALQRCDAQIKWFTRHNNRQGGLANAFTVATVVFSALATLSALWTDLPTIVRALPGALAAISASASGTFAWRAERDRSLWALELLKAERAKYITRAGPAYALSVDDEDALGNFVIRLERINLQHTAHVITGNVDVGRSDED
jgi:hypothetical protein